MKSGPTSGPLTVSSHVIHEPHGITPPLQLNIVPFRLVWLRTTSPKGVTSTVVVPAPAFASYGVPVPNAGTLGLLVISWLRTSTTLRLGPRKAPMPSCRPGSTVPSSRVTGDSVSWKDRYEKPAGRCSRTIPSRASGIGRSARNAALGAAAAVGGASKPWNGPPASAATAALLSTVRRSTSISASQARGPPPTVHARPRSGESQPLDGGWPQTVPGQDDVGFGSPGGPKSTPSPFHRRSVDRGWSALPKDHDLVSRAVGLVHRFWRVDRHAVAIHPASGMRRDAVANGGFSAPGCGV